MVVPTSLLFNWASELITFAPSLDVSVYHGSARQSDELTESLVVLTTYGILAREKNRLASIRFDTVVLDESQMIKNPISKAHVAACALNAGHRICLTGTPVQNKLDDLWAQIHLCSPGLLGDARSFHKRYTQDREKRDEGSGAQDVQARIKPFMLRRTKATVRQDLPEKTEIVERVLLGRAQADLYRATRSLLDEEVNEAIAKRGIEQASITILTALLRLRQICCDPRLLNLNGKKSAQPSAKLERLLELVATLLQEDRRVLIFSQFTSMLALIGAELGRRKVSYLQLTGQTQRREDVVQAFQNKEAPVMLISLKAGGVGLDLTAADTAIHYGPWSTPPSRTKLPTEATELNKRSPSTSTSLSSLVASRKRCWPCKTTSAPCQKT